jgi:hypothetical protein
MRWRCRKKCCDVGCCDVVVLIRRWEIVYKITSKDSVGIVKHGGWFGGSR